MNRTFKSNLCLLGTALIWGFALVAQRDSMSVMGPFMYNAIRMFLGSAALVPVFIISDRIKRRSSEADESRRAHSVEGRYYCRRCDIFIYEFAAGCSCFN